MAASLGDFQKSINGLRDVTLILEETHSKIASLIPFQIMTFYLVNEEDNDFIHARTTPSCFADYMIKEIEKLIEKGIFAFSLREKRPTRISSSNRKKQFILHALSTRSRIRGMFIGLVEEKSGVTEASLSLLSIILLNSANAIESFHLYTMIRQVKETLQKKETYKVLFEAAPDGVEVLDAWGHIIDINETQKALLGYERNEIVAKHTTDFFSGICSASFKKCASLLREKGFCEGEIELISKDGSPVPVWRKEKAIYGSDGKIAGSVVYNRDLTQLKKMEKARRSLEEQLQRAKKMEAFGLMAGGVAHDLNSVLSGIMNYPELLLAQVSPNDPMRKHLRAIQKCGEKAAAIVQDLLVLARRKTADHEAVDINRVIFEYLESPEYCGLIKRHPHVSVTTDLIKTISPVKGSALQLSKVVMNLVTNAVEAVSGKGEVLLKTENRLVKESHGRFEEIAEGEYVLFIIADSGMGIDADDSERIFEPFFTKKKMGRSGTGLGMTIVWGAVKDHGGYIDMESRKGEGTTFTVYLPADVCAKREYETVPVDPVRRNYRGKGETILVVDDDENQREVMTSLLDVMNYKVIAVPSGEAALEYLKMHSADLVLLDMIMGSGMDGLETYRGIARRRPFQKTVIVSGYSDTERIREAQKLGAGPYIRKPCKLEVLSKTVREELDK